MLDPEPILKARLRWVAGQTEPSVSGVAKVGNGGGITTPAESTEYDGFGTYEYRRWVVSKSILIPLSGDGGGGSGSRTWTVEVPLEASFEGTAAENSGGFGGGVFVSADNPVPDSRIFSFNAAPNSSYSTIKNLPDDKELSAYAKISWKDDGVPENPLVPFYQGAGAFSISATRDNQTIALSDYRWSAPQTFVPEVPILTEFERSYRTPEGSTSSKQFYWDFGSDPSQLPKDTNVTVTATDSSDGAEMTGKALIHWHWAFENAGGTGGSNGGSSLSGLPGTMVTMAPFRDDSGTQHNPPPKSIDQVQPGEKIQLPGKPLRRVVTNKETLPDGTIVLHLGIDPDDNPDDPAFSDMEQVERVLDAYADAQAEGQRDVKTALEVYKAVAEQFAYGPFYNLGGAVLGTIGGKATELLSQSEKAKAAASYVRNVLNEVEALLPKLKQKLAGLTKGSDEAAQLTSKIDELEEGARKLAKGADELDDIAKHTGDLADETQIIVAEVQRGNGWQQGQDPAELNAGIQAKLNSTNSNVANRAADRLEGEVANMLKDDIVRFNQQIKGADGKILTEIDIETSRAIIEVTTSRGGKPQQMARFGKPMVNPSGKPIIIYAPNYVSKAELSVLEAGAYKVVRNEQELRAVLQELAQGG